MLLKQKDIVIGEQVENIIVLENKCLQLQDWVDRLLVYMDLEERDLMKILQRDKDSAETISKFNDLLKISKLLLR